MASVEDNETFSVVSTADDDDSECGILVIRDSIRGHDDGYHHHDDGPDDVTVHSHNQPHDDPATDIFISHHDDDRDMATPPQSLSIIDDDIDATTTVVDATVVMGDHCHHSVQLTGDDEVTHGDNPGSEMEILNEGESLSILADATISTSEGLMVSGDTGHAEIEVLPANSEDLEGVSASYQIHLNEGGQICIVSNDASVPVTFTSSSFIISSRAKPTSGLDADDGSNTVVHLLPDQPSDVHHDVEIDDKQPGADMDTTPDNLHKMLTYSALELPQCKQRDDPLLGGVGDDRLSTSCVVFICQVCSHEFNTPKELQQHMTKSHTIVLKDDSLQRQTTVPSTEQSLNLEPGPGHDQFVCLECGREFKRKASLKKHLQGCHIQAEPSVYNCDHCEEEFKTAYQLQQHLSAQHGEDVSVVFKCGDCGQEFTKDKALVNHMKTHRSPSKRPRKTEKMSCTTCGKFFRDITAHVKVHLDQRPYKCPHCPKTYRHCSNLRDHVTIHTGEKRFQCNVCSWRFRKRGNLYAHMRTHSGEKPHKCLQCGRAFARSTDLNVHKRIHTGEQPYCCEYCGKGFTRSGDLREHIRIHTNERPFECGYCKKKFKRSSDLRVHKRLHSGERPYECSVCSKKFTRSFSLRSHQRTHSLTAINTNITSTSTATST